MNATIVTALYDIGREKIDGRDMSQYYAWFSRTLLFNCPMVIYCDESLNSFITMNRPSHLQTKIINQKLEEIPYYHLKPQIDEVLQSLSYKQKIKDPERIECKTSLYSIIQYSKFPWVLNAAINNYFQSDYFFWMDAGASRFIPDLQIKDLNFPGPVFSSKHTELKNKALFQMYIFPYTDLSLKPDHLPHDYLYDNRSYVWGGMFGVDKSAIENLTNCVDFILREEMLEKHLINNEQIAIGYLLKNKKYANDFLVLRNDSRFHKNFELMYQAFI